MMQREKHNNWRLKPLKHKLFNIFLVFVSFLSPTLLIAAFLDATYSGGKSISCCSISSAISNPSTYTEVLILTTFAVIGSAFVCICRQIQIKVIFSDLDFTKYKKWTNINTVAVFFNIVGWIFLELTVIFDSGRGHIMHIIFAVLH
eukprot:299397_1